jgi:TM2 domain-containing membrane protein YozV/RNA polymerase subunit RPABC4/transcription elongation factor Spt4
MQSLFQFVTSKGGGIVYCRNCGIILPDYTSACAGCGLRPLAGKSHCQQCGSETNEQAVLCVNCGASLSQKGARSKIVAGVLAILLGGFGIHKFYLRAWGWGIVYLLFSWTSIPSFIAILEGILYLIMDDATFDERYNYRKMKAFSW